MQLEEGQRIAAPFLSGVAEAKRFAPKRGYYLLEVVLQDGHHTFQPLRITDAQLAAVQVPSQEHAATTKELDIEHNLVAQRVVTKRGSNVALLLPRQRRVRGRVAPEAKRFECWLDAVHTAMLVYQEDGAQACEAFLQRAGLWNDGTFKACLQAMLNAVPRTRIKGQFVRAEAELLERLRVAFYDELEAPDAVEGSERIEQLRLEL
jgi:hypothetical protein